LRTLRGRDAIAAKRANVVARYPARFDTLPAAPRVGTTLAKATLRTLCEHSANTLRTLCEHSANTLRTLSEPAGRQVPGRVMALRRWRATPTRPQTTLTRAPSLIGGRHEAII